jgi:hypothetical protein
LTSEMRGGDITDVASLVALGESLRG